MAPQQSEGAQLTHFDRVGLEFGRQPRDIGLGAFLPQHRVDRISHEAEHGEGDKAHDQKHEHRLGDASNDIGQHEWLRLARRKGEGGRHRARRPSGLTSW